MERPLKQKEMFREDSQNPLVKARGTSIEDMDISDTTDMNSFITGFILGNNVMLREKFLELRRKEKANETKK